jgi:hypothetical protein
MFRVSGSVFHIPNVHATLISALRDVGGRFIMALFGYQEFGSRNLVFKMNSFIPF